MTNNNISEIVNTIYVLSQSHTHYYEKNSQCLIFEKLPQEKVDSSFLKKITHEWRGEGELAIELQTIDYTFFYNQDHFLKDFDLNQTKEDFAILFNDTSFLLFNASTHRVSNHIELLPSSNLIENTIYYLKLLALFSDPTFCNYTDTTVQKIILTSGKKGTLVIGYPLPHPAFLSTYCLRKTYEKIQSRWQIKGYAQFLKTEIIDWATRTTVERERFPDLVKNLPHLIELTDCDFEVYISDFSFEKFKENFRAEKERYFNSIREIVSKFSTQVTSVPISISASTFASYRVDSTYTLLFILAGFTTYAGYVTYLLRSIKKDLQELFLDFTHDQEKINERKLGADKEVHYHIKKISNRFRRTKKMIQWFSWIIHVLSLLFIGYLIIQIIKK